MAAQDAPRRLSVPAPYRGHPAPTSTSAEGKERRPGGNVTATIERRPRGGRVRRGLDRSDVVLEGVPVPFRGEPEVLRIKWMMQVWTVVSGQTLPTTSGSPFSPSQTRKHVPHPTVADVGEHAHPEPRG